MTENTPRLCYVENNVAWFSHDFDSQWGDDWNDQPYEHNAGTPYSDWGLTRFYYEGPFDLPCDHHRNSPYSVQTINQGACPWLRSASWADREEVCIMAGATIDEFLAKVEAAGGVAVEIPKRHTQDSGNDQ